MDQLQNDTLRNTIDELDEALLALIDQRVTLAKIIIRRKQAQGVPIVDLAREQQLIGRLQRRSWDNLTDADVNKIITEVIAIGKS